MSVHPAPTPPGPGGSEPPDAVSVVEAFLEQLPSDLLAGVERYCADDLEWRFPPSLTGGKPWIGKETVMRRLGRVLGNFQLGTMQIVGRGATIAAGDGVAVEFDLTATTAHGRDYANSYVFFFTCKDGRITSVREYMDTAVVLAAIAPPSDVQ